MSRDYPVTLMYVPRRPKSGLFSSLSNVLNHHVSMYLAQSIASNQAYPQMLSRSVTLRLNSYN